MCDEDKTGARERDRWDAARRHIQQLDALIGDVEKLGKRRLVRWLCGLVVAALAYSAGLTPHFLQQLLAR